MVTRQDFSSTAHYPMETLAAKKDHVSDRKKALYKVPVLVACYVTVLVACHVTVLVACHVTGAEI